MNGTTVEEITHHGDSNTLKMTDFLVDRDTRRNGLSTQFYIHIQKGLRRMLTSTITSIQDYVMR